MAPYSIWFHSPKCVRKARLAPVLSIMSSASCALSGSKSIGEEDGNRKPLVMLLSVIGFLVDKKNLQNDDFSIFDASESWASLK